MHYYPQKDRHLHPLRSVSPLITLSLPPLRSTCLDGAHLQCQSTCLVLRECPSLYISQLGADCSYNFILPVRPSPISLSLDPAFRNLLPHPSKWPQPELLPKRHQPMSHAVSRPPTSTQPLSAQQRRPTPPQRRLTTPILTRPCSHAAPAPHRSCPTSESRHGQPRGRIRQLVTTTVSPIEGLQLQALVMNRG
jgi:hypothetical protein